jgi:hypothetical protein
MREPPVLAGDVRPFVISESSSEPGSLSGEQTERSAINANAIARSNEAPSTWTPMSRELVRTATGALTARACGVHRESRFQASFTRRRHAHRAYSDRSRFASTLRLDRSRSSVYVRPLFTTKFRWR